MKRDNLTISGTFLKVALLVLLIVSGLSYLQAQHDTNLQNPGKKNISKNDQNFEELIKQSKKQLLSSPEKAKSSAFKALDIAQKKPGNDTNTVKALILVGKSHKELGYYNLAGHYLSQAKEIISSFNHPTLKAMVYADIAETYIINNEYDKALKYIEKLKRIGTSLDNKKFQASALKLKGMFHAKTDNKSKALHAYLEALNLLKNEQDNKLKAEILNKIGHVSQKAGKYDEAESYFSKALHIYQNIGCKPGEAKTLNNHGTLYLKQEKYAEALRYKKKALAIFEETENKAYIARTLYDIGNIFSKQNDHGKSQSFYNKSLDLSKSLNDNILIIKNLLKSGRVHLKTHNENQGIKLAQQALTIADSLKDKKYLQHTYLLLADLHQSQENFKKALTNYQLYSGIKDSLLKHKIKQKRMELEAQFKPKDADKKPENQNLKKENNLQQDKIKTKESETKVLIVTIILLLVIIVLIFISFMQKRKTTKVQEQKNSMINKYKDELLEKNKALKLQNQKLEEINKEKNNLMGIVSHDLKSPLNKIAGFVHILELSGDNLDHEQKDCLNKINRTIADGRNMISNLLELSKLNDENTDTTFREVNIDRLLQDLTGSYKNRARQKAINLRYYNQMTHPYVYADKTHLYQIFDNLLSNALKFSERDKNIYIRTYNVVDKIRIEFEDEGPGLTKEDQQNLFKKYKRLSARPTDDESSTGLGLHIVKTLVDMNQGNIWVESEKDKGSKFTIEFNKYPSD